MEQAEVEQVEKKVQEEPHHIGLFPHATFPSLSSYSENHYGKRYPAEKKACFSSLTTGLKGPIPGNALASRPGNRCTGHLTLRRHTFQGRTQCTWSQGWHHDQLRQVGTAHMSWRCWHWRSDRRCSCGIARPCQPFRRRMARSGLALRVLRADPRRSRSTARRPWTVGPRRMVSRTRSS